MVFATMGSNFADFDNDGWLDMYLGTGDPTLATWSPTGCSRTSKAGGSPRSPAPPAPATCRKATASPAATGTATATSISSSRWAAPCDGDQYHNVLFQNPGQGNNWLTVKLMGKKTNRAAIGARIKVVTAGEKPLDDPPPRHLRQQLRRQPAGADDRPGQGRADR